MSGFEIVGVVLGLFPLVYNLAQDLRDVSQDARAWWRFETEFEDFIMNIEKEYIAFSQILDIFLESLDELSQVEREALLGNPNSLLWFDLRIQRVLTHRVDERYHGWFMKQVRDIDDSLEELHRLLPIEKAHYLDGRSLESKIFRFKTSFSHKKNRLLSRIGAGNTKLYEYLERAAYLQHYPPSTQAPPKGSAKATTSFLEFQEQARSIFKGFQKHWICSGSCAGGHSCGISVQGPDLKVLFSNGTERKHVKVEVNLRGRLTNPSEPSPSPCLATRQEDVTGLRAEVDFRRGVKKLSEGPKSIMKLTASTLSTLSNPTNIEAGGDYEGRKMPPKRPKKSVGPQAEGEMPVARVSRVKFDSPPQPVTTNPAPPATTNGRDQAISNMCLAISKKDKAPCLGFLELPNVRLFLHLDPPDYIPQLLEIQTLEEFMESTPRRDSRLKLGLDVTTTLLNLGPSWVPEGWHKSSLLLLRTPESLPQPYISHPSIQTTLKAASTSTAEKARASLLSLGILLLELLFRDSLERQPFRATYLGSAGEPTDMTDLCTAMKWQTKVEEEFGNKLAYAIRSCVSCAFGPTPDLGSSKFVQAVWTTVARPLEEFLQVYSGEA